MTATVRRLGPPHADKFYILQTVFMEGARFKEIDATPLGAEDARGIECYDLFWDERGGTFVVTEGRSGMRVSAGGSKDAAIRQARAVLLQPGLFDKIERLVARQVKANGLSPRWTP